MPPESFTIYEGGDPLPVPGVRAVQRHRYDASSTMS